MTKPNFQNEGRIYVFICIATACIRIAAMHQDAPSSESHCTKYHTHKTKTFSASNN